MIKKILGLLAMVAAIKLCLELKSITNIDEVYLYGVAFLLGVLCNDAICYTKIKRNKKN